MKRWKILYFFISAIMFIGVVFVVHKHLYPSEDRIKVFTAFFDVPGESRDEDNIMKEIIAQNIGAKCDELFLKC